MPTSPPLLVVMEPQHHQIPLNILQLVLMFGGRQGGEDGLHSLEPLHREGGVSGEAGPDVVLGCPAQQGQVHHLTGRQAPWQQHNTLGDTLVVEMAL